MKKFSLILILTLVLPLVFCSCGNSSPDREIGGYEIEGELYDFLGKTDEKAAEFLAVYSLADRYGVDFSSEKFEMEVEAEMSRILAEDYSGDADALDDDLDSFGIDDDIYEKIVEQDLLKTKVYLKLTESGTIETDRAKIKTELSNGGSVRIKRILIPYGVSEETKSDAEKGIKAAWDKIQAGYDFDEVVKDMSKYTYATIGGSLEDGSYIVVKGKTEKGYEDVCFNLSVGEVSDPFETSSGYCIVKRYELDLDLIDSVLDNLVTAYCEGQYNMMLDEAAEKLLEK